jgi:hypothetical protein
MRGSALMCVRERCRNNIFRKVQYKKLNKCKLYKLLDDRKYIWRCFFHLLLMFLLLYLLIYQKKIPPKLTYYYKSVQSNNINFDILSYNYYNYNHILLYDLCEISSIPLQITYCKIVVQYMIVRIIVFTTTSTITNNIII